MALLQHMTIQRSYGHAYLGRCLTPGSVVLDVGANVGEFCADIAARTQCRVYAIEPVPELARSILPHPRVTVEKVALAGRSGTQAFFASPDEYATMIPSFRRPGQTEIEVPVIRLDEFLRTREIERVALMKIDAEGAEHQIVAGAGRDALARIDQVSIEFHEFLHPDEGPAIARTAATLRAAGFTQLDLSRGYASDVLFLNRRRVGAVTRAYLAARHIYGPRIARR